MRTVADGNAMLAPSVTRRLISSFAEIAASQADDARARLEMLTERERDVIIEVAA